VIFPLLTEDGAPRINPDNVLEERDTQYDAMLSQMVGRIKSKPGGKLETGEVSYQDSFLLFVYFFSLNSWLICTIIQLYCYLLIIDVPETLSNLLVAMCINMVLDWHWSKEKEKNKKSLFIYAFLGVLR